MNAISVVLADPEKERRAACLSRLSPEEGIRVVAEASTARETLGAARFLPRVLLIDSSLARGTGLVLLNLFRRRSPESRIILLTGETSRSALFSAITHGAFGCLNRRQVRAFLPKAVRKVDAGEPWIPRTLLPAIIDAVIGLS